jgi:hypothetical protein
MIDGKALLVEMFRSGVDIDGCDATLPTTVTVLPPKA